MHVSDKTKYCDVAPFVARMSLFEELTTYLQYCEVNPSAGEFVLIPSEGTLSSSPMQREISTVSEEMHG